MTNADGDPSNAVHAATDKVEAALSDLTFGNKQHVLTILTSGWKERRWIGLA
jgi:hypothetical protein